MNKGPSIDALFVSVVLGLAVAGRVYAGPAEDDFQKRATAPGVVRAMGFDTAADVNNRILADGVFAPSGSGYDTSVHASGAGSLRFTVPSLSAANTSGSWRINFTDDYSVLFGQNQEFYVQWRQRFDNAMLSNAYAGADGWKTIIIGQGDTSSSGEVSSCSELELVSFNGYMADFPRLYHNCGVYAGFYEPYGNGDFKLQNAMPAPYCLYSDHTYAGCFKYYPNEWMTFQIHIKMGPLGTAFSTLENQQVTGFTNSLVELWVAREGQPSTLVISWPGVVLHETQGAKYGKVWLLPYNTNKNATISYPVANTWYDELIVSRSKIADPGVVTVRPSPPTNATAH
jgi:hypothetical protein